ncbi:hypothetical protein [Undibacterium parvum]|uniref:Uncharacterized protein n=2 Tax=Undibacterium TaxID=401469 RepID=A0A6M4A6J5_9BURK|nr:hypothetical protein [Undibacterium parvum]AZP12554.1 hypothetical protein EJN92_11380 [Undibacterium parvum]QJQ06775.1 hypothetical protein EJG51_014015 [Undibacterium piscinae]
MICIAVHRNDELVCKAGIANASLLSVILAGGLYDDDPTSFHVAGLQDLSEERNAHVYWVHETPLSVGNRLSFTLVQCDEPSPPIEVKATDSSVYLEEQREFEEFEKNYMEPERQLDVRWPTLGLRLMFNSEDLVAARLLDGEEQIMCSIHWDKWRPERCRVYVRSFASRGQGTATPTDWFRGFLELGDRFEVSVHV